LSVIKFVVDELELIRQRKLAELRKKLAQEQTSEQVEEKPSEANVLEQLEAMVNRFLTPEARQRLYNIKLAHPDKYMVALQVLYSVIQRYQQKIDDATLKKLLAKVFSQTRREPKIKFK